MTITKETAYKLYDLDKKIVECTRQLETLMEKREETIMADLRKKLFQAMKNDLGVMAEHNDSEESLLAELNSADPEILEMYADTFLD